MTNPRKRKAKSVKAKPTKQTQPEPQPGPSQTDDSVCQAESDPPPPELQAEGEVQPNEEEDSLEVDEGSGLVTKKKKLLTALTPEQEEEMVEWLSEHPVLWNKKMKDYKDTQMKEALWIEQAGKMDKDVNELKVWYKSLRTRFGRLKKMPSGSGTQEFSERDKWILQKLKFLRPHIADVSKRTAVSVSIF